MKICFFSLAMVVGAFSNLFASPIPTYQELKSSIYEGKHFVILVDHEQCTGRSGKAMGYFIPKAMMLIPATDTQPEYVTTSDLHFTDIFGKPSYEYVKYTFYSDDSATIRSVFYDPQDFKPLGSERKIHCSLDKGVEIHSGN